MRLGLYLLSNMIVVLAVLSTIFAAPATAAAPDLTGVWVVEAPYYLGRPLTPAPDLLPAVQAQARKRAAAAQAGYVWSVSGMLCGPSGGPQMFMVRSPFEIFSGFGRLTIIFENESNNQPRTIYMNEATHPGEIYPSFNGHSIGHWEGRVLVVDTIGFVGRGPLIGNIPKSTRTHTIERFDLLPDGQKMSITLSVDDPSTLAKPWKTTLRFDRMPDREERFQVWCDVDLASFSALDLGSLQDVDPEVARLLKGYGADPTRAVAKSLKAGASTDPKSAADPDRAALPAGDSHR